MKITIVTLPHDTQRYPTVGDWIFKGEDVLINVSEMKDWRYEACVAVHELVEALICRHRGIEEEHVSAFDIDYEKKRLPGDVSEPGDHPDAPYREAHQTATTIERVLAEALRVNWDEYEKVANTL